MPINVKLFSPLVWQTIFMVVKVSPYKCEMTFTPSMPNRIYGGNSTAREEGAEKNFACGAALQEGALLQGGGLEKFFPAAHSRGRAGVCRAVLQRQG